MKAKLTDEAEADLVMIGDYIAEDNPERAITFAHELLAACISIGDLPRAYPLVSGLEERGIRRRPHRRYGIFYHILPDRVEILRVLHGARDHERLLGTGGS